ncbi:hypothetical protein MZM54_03795 [[Brevibacterium] frigoritolerans]|nr:hypothetical protein [Peribacillus frigoritolerans]
MSKNSKVLLIASIAATVIAVGIYGLIRFGQGWMTEMEEVDTYIVEMNKLKEKDIRFQSEMDTEFYDEENNDKAYSYLVKTVIPNYKSFNREIKKIDITYKDLKEIQAIYIESNDLYMTYLLDTKKSMEVNKEKFHDQAYEELSDVDYLMAKHDALLEKLAEENGSTLRVK